MTGRRVDRYVVALAVLMLASAPRSAHAQTGSISGAVIDADTGAGIAGVSVAVYRRQVEGGGISLVATRSTDGNGAYSVDPLPSATYYLRTSNTQNYIDELYDNIECVSCSISSGTGVLLSGTQLNRTGVNFVLSRGATISGTVREATTGTGLAMTVRVSNAAGTIQKSATSTPGAGAFTVDGLPPGTYYARTVASGAQNYLDKLYDSVICVPSCPLTNGTPIVLAARGARTGVDFALERGAAITGTVTAVSTGLGLGPMFVNVYDVAGTLVTMTQSAAASGTYRVDKLRPGLYYALVGPIGGLDYIGELFDDIECSPLSSPSCPVTGGTPILLASQETRNGVDFALTRGATISGSVTDADTGAGLGFVFVRVFSAAGTLVSDGFADSSGYYIVGGLAAGAYYVQLRATNQPDYVDELYDDVECTVPSCTLTAGVPVVVTAEGTKAGVNFALARGATISGIITDSDTGTPISGVDVYLYTAAGLSIFDAGGNGRRTTFNGRYTFTGLAAGTYYLRTVNAQNYVDELYDDVECVVCTVTHGTPIVLAAREARTGVNFALQPGATISGTVNGLQSVLVEVFDAAGTFVKNAVGITGAYNVTGLPAGTYYARTANTQNYVNQLYAGVACIVCTPTDGTPIVLASRETRVGVNFPLAPGAQIIGSVTDADTGQGLSVAVQVFDAAGTLLKSVSPIGGSYSIGGLFRGTYYVRTAVSPADNHVDQLYANIVCMPTCTVTSGTPIVVRALQTHTVNFALVRGATINGRVLDATTNAGIGPVTVQAYSASGVFIKSADSTPGAGSFTISGLPAGSFFLRTLVTTATQMYMNELYDNISCARGCSVTTGSPIVLAAGGAHTGVIFSLTRRRSVLSDFDGDGSTDVSVFRPSDGVWYVVNSSTGQATGLQWGNGDDRPVPADYDGDGKTDIAVFRPSDGVWYVVNSSTSQATGFQWGNGLDIPVPGDYDGDGKSDIAVFRPADGTWYVVNSNTGQASGVQWGNALDIPVPGDYDGDGKTDIAVFRPSDGTWYVIRSTYGALGVQWGNGRDIPTPRPRNGLSSH